MMWLLCPLVVLMILGAVVSLEAANLLSSVVVLGIIGFALSAVFLVLEAPDLAIVQIVIETLALIIFIAVILKTRSEDLSVKARARMPFYAISALFVVVFMLAAALAMKSMPPFGEPALRMAGTYLSFDEMLLPTGAANLVTAVVLDFRGYDTLGEATVLFTAVAGVVAVLRKVGRKD
jgi:multicomponent Na+:H+ antiporter subunit B